MRIPQSKDKERVDLSSSQSGLCSQFKNLGVSDDKNAGNKVNTGKLRKDTKNEQCSQDESLDQIGKNLQNIKITDEKEKPNDCSKSSNDGRKNVSEKEAKHKKVWSHLRNIPCRVIVSPDSNEKPIAQTNKKEESSENVNEITPVPIKEKHEDQEKEINQAVGEKTKEVKENNSSDILCSRGPTRNNLLSIHRHYQPYQNPQICSIGHHSGGSIVVTEPVREPLNIPSGVNITTPQNNIPFNMSPEFSECGLFPLEKCPVDRKPAAEMTDEETIELAFKILSQNEVIQETINVLLNGCKGETVKDHPVYTETDDEVLSPGSCDLSPIGSPQNTGSFMQPPPSVRSHDSISSGIFSSYGSHYDTTQSPPPINGPSPPHTIENSQTSVEEWLKNATIASVNNCNPARLASSTLTTIPARVAPFQNPEQPRPVPIVPKPPPSTVKPGSAKERLMKKLNEDDKLHVWASLMKFPDSVFEKGDDDGDTQLMIILSNECKCQLEFIYAIVERMRNIKGSLAIENKAGQSALYVACLAMSREPLVAAYIAEALVEEKVDVSTLTYANGRTLIQIIENEGNTNSELLNELLSLKDSSGQHVFPSPHPSDINGNICKMY